MPQTEHWFLPGEGEIGVWKINEDIQFFMDRLMLSPAEQEQALLLKGKRKIEWLATRYLLHEMSGRTVRGEVLKDQFGKPHLEGTNWHISFSHTHEFVAVIASPALNGIDIQFIVSKIERIAHKYMSAEEMACLSTSDRIEHLHVFWGAKEALYKAYGRKQLNFKKHLSIAPFELDFKRGKSKGIITKDGFRQVFDVHYTKVGETILVWVLESND